MRAQLEKRGVLIRCGPNSKKGGLRCGPTRFDLILLNVLRPLAGPLEKGGLRCESGKKGGVFAMAHTYAGHICECPPPRDLNDHSEHLTVQRGFNIQKRRFNTQRGNFTISVHLNILEVF